jgi:signal peptidase I
LALLQKKENPKQQFFMRKSYLETIFIIIIAIVLFVGLRLTIQTSIVNGPSMEPNFQQNEWIIVNKLAYKYASPQRGDVIIFQPPFQNSKPFIKRVIGLPGEVVQIENGKVYVHKTDGSIITLQEPYIKEPFATNYTSPVIPPNEYFVMGDNRNNSTDSRYGWLASRDKIMGKVWITIWPPYDWGGSDTYRQPSPVMATPVFSQQIAFFYNTA